jgi:hypothetical protein
VSLKGSGVHEVLVDPWLPVAGTTPWTRLTPEYVEQPTAPDQTLSVELRVVDAPIEDVWSNVGWHLDATDGERDLRYPLRPGEVVRSGWGAFRRRVTLRIPELGAAGVRTDVSPTGNYVFELRAADVLSVTGGVSADFTGLPRAPGPEETSIVLSSDDGRPTLVTWSGMEARGVPVGQWQARIKAPWVSSLKQPVVIEPGRTTLVRAAPAPPPLTGRIRGRVDVAGDASWLRVREVTLTNAHGSREKVTTLSRLSFGAELAPGSWHGRVAVGQVGASARSQPDPDLVRHDLDRSDETPLEASFTCEVTAGSCTDVVVSIDASQLCVLQLILPVEEQRAAAAAPDSWWVYELRREGSGPAVAQDPLRSWPEAGLLLRVGPGRYTVVADRRLYSAQYGIAQQLEASIEIAAFDRARSLELSRKPPPTPAVPVPNR